MNQVQLPGYLAKNGNGWALTGTKHADIDFDDCVYSGSPTLAAFGFALNGDSYQVGKRFFRRANVNLLPGVSVFGFYTHQIDSKEAPLTYPYTRQNLNFGMQFDFKAMLEKAHLLSTLKPRRRESDALGVRPRPGGAGLDPVTVVMKQPWVSHCSTPVSRRL